MKSSRQSAFHPDTAGGELLVGGEVGVADGLDVDGLGVGVYVAVGLGVTVRVGVVLGMGVTVGVGLGVPGVGAGAVVPPRVTVTGADFGEYCSVAVATICMRCVPDHAGEVHVSAWVDAT